MEVEKIDRINALAHKAKSVGLTEVIHKITEGRRYGTLFVSQSKEEVYLIDIIDRLL